MEVGGRGGEGEDFDLPVFVRGESAQYRHSHSRRKEWEEEEEKQILSSTGGGIVSLKTYAFL
eukprot:768512-Hanusia_phi.AAC.3